LETKLRTVSIQEILATRARATFNYRVNFDSILRDNVEVMQQWCEKNCEGLWRCETHFALYFQFEEEKDATMFMLRWGTANGNKLK
jgi:hypothetical protein